jgi:hypothetical protein
MNQFARQSIRGVNVQYMTGFRPQRPTSEFPYFVIQVDEEEVTGTYDDIERELATIKQPSTDQLRGPLAEAIRNLSVDQAVLDRARNRILQRGRLEIPGLGPCEYITVVNLGSKATVIVHCCSTPSSFPQHLPMFTQVNDSFRFDKGTSSHLNPAVGCQTRAVESWSSA